MINLSCPKCGTEGIVKRWENTHSGERPWAFCPKCKYKWYANMMEKTKRFMQDDDGHWYLINSQNVRLFNKYLEEDEDAFIDAFDEYRCDHPSNYDVVIGG